MISSISSRLTSLSEVSSPTVSRTTWVTPTFFKHTTSTIWMKQQLPPTVENQCRGGRIDNFLERAYIVICMFFSLFAQALSQFRPHGITEEFSNFNHFIISLDVTTSVSDSMRNQLTDTVHLCASAFGIRLRNIGPRT